MPYIRATVSPKWRLYANRKCATDYCFLSASAQTNPLTPMVTENGYINLSLDALGTTNSSGYIQVNKPANATVRSAYLIAASTGFSKVMLSDGDITIDGASVIWSSTLNSSISSYNHWADVTSLIKHKLDASPAGLVDFLITENNSYSIDGTILAVIFDDPGQTELNTIVLFFGAQDVNGDNFYIRYAEPINLADPKLRLDFSLGISYGYQSSSQYSIIEVNGKRLTTSAGGQDDGTASDGALITVGGIGDVNTNPVDPLATPTNCRDDDELYNLIPFVAHGDTITHVFSQNPSNNDNIFFAALFSSVTSIVGEGILLSPGVDTNLIGVRDTLTAKVQNSFGNPVVGRKVIFEIVSGPHAGIKDSSTTNAMGEAIFTYTGVTTGQDQIIAKMINSSMDTTSSNLAYHFWTKSDTNNPPTTNPVFITDPNNASPEINWTYSDVDGDPQFQYEVEVWTGPNGTGTNFWDPPVGSGIVSSVIYSGTALLNGQTYYARVRANDGTVWGKWSEESWIYLPNFSPIANAGPDQEVPVDSSCNAPITLDASGSKDPDGGTIKYTWNGPGGPWEDSTVVITLPVGTHTIYLIVVDDENSSDTDSVTISVIDTLAPIPEIETLPVIHGSCSVTLKAPTAIDNCSGVITGTTDSLTYTTQGTRTVTWTYTDNSGNKSTQTQTVIVKDTIAPIINSSESDTVAIIKESANSIDLQIDSASATDNCTKTIITASRSDGLPLDTLFFEGITRITWTACDVNGNCDSVFHEVTVKRNKAPVVTAADTSMLEGEIITLQITASDPDGTVPVIFMDSCPVPYSFIDHHNGTATVEFRPGCTDHGIYEISIYGSDGIDTVKDTFTLTIGDVNFDPVFDTTSYYIAWETKEFTATFRVFDCDGTIPEIRIKNCPHGASFSDNHDGTATLLWTPDADDNGYYLIVLEANDDHITIKDTIIIEIKDINAYPPVLTLSTTDTTRPVNQELIIYARAEDQDGTPPVIKATNLPHGAYFESDNEGNAILKWTPPDTGVFMITITAIDLVDSTSFDSKLLTIRITNDNTSKPVFKPHHNVEIDQNQKLELIVEALDPDGTIPMLSLITKPQGANFTDNCNGSGTITWIPDCDISGAYAFTAVATDGKFYDSLTVTVTVRDINCAPVLYKISDINAQYGDPVRFEIDAYDPDNDSSELYFSISCDLPGYTFKTSDDGKVVFGWYVNCSSGSFPVRFYVTDGQLTDSTDIYIHVGKSGSVKIAGHPQGAKIYALPSGCYRGEYLGTDSVVFSAIPGIYHFQMQLEGYRPQNFTCDVKADTTIMVSHTLKPVIPIMLAPAETLITQKGDLAIDGSFSLADINRDGILDISSLTGNQFTAYYGISSSSLVFRPTKSTINDLIKIINPFHHLFVDWNNDRTYDCLYSDISGNILLVNLKMLSIDTIVKATGSRNYPVVYDVNNDHKKDLIVHSEGKGLFIYLNTGSDANPQFQFATECTDSSGASLISLTGAFTIVDIDGDGSEEFIARENEVLRLFKIKNQFESLTLSEDLNCGGSRDATKSADILMIESVQGKPALIIRKGDKLLVYSTRLRGDINGDKKVDIRDISEISRNWEIIDSDLNWNPSCNLNLSAKGSEIIDIRDITKASSCWELQE